jgi:hypothetical protein
MKKPTTTRVSTRWEAKNLCNDEDGKAMLQYAATDAHASRMIYVAIRDGEVPAIEHRVGGQVDNRTQAESNRRIDELLRQLEIQESNRAQGGEAAQAQEVRLECICVQLQAILM